MEPIIDETVENEMLEDAGMTREELEDENMAPREGEDAPEPDAPRPGEPGFIGPLEDEFPLGQACDPNKMEECESCQ